MSPNTQYLSYLYSQMFGLGGLGSENLVVRLVGNNASLALLFAVPVAFSGMAEAANLESKIRINRYVLIMLGVIAAISLLMIEGTNSFIYIKF